MVDLSARGSAKNAPWGQCGPEFPVALLSLSLILAGGAACSSETPSAGKPRAEPELDTTAPTLVNRTPEPEQVAVYAFAPISLTFSEALAESTVNASAFELRADTESAPLKLEVRLAEDRRKVELMLVNAPRGPARVTLDVARTLKDVAGNAFAGTSWSWQLPVWFNGKSPENKTAPASLGVSLAVESDAGAVLVWEDNTSGSVLKAARLLGATWTPLGEFLNQNQHDPAEFPSVVNSSDGPVAAWLEGATNPNLFVKRWDGKTWTLLGPGAVNTLAAAGPVLSADETGTLTVTWIENASRVHVARWTSTAWEALVEPFVSPTEIQRLDVVFRQGSLVLAIAHGSVDSTDLAVFSWDAAVRTWRQLGPPLDRQLGDTVRNPSLASAADGSIAVAWQENDGTSDHLYVSQYDPPSETWRLLGSALDLEIDDNATLPELAFQKTNEPLIAWRESRGAQAFSYVMRWAQGRWQALGAFTSPQGLGERIALAVDERDNPSVVIQAGDRLEVHRFNGTPELPFGLLPRKGESGCKLPDDEDPNFPRTLSATGCYGDVAKRVPAGGAFPFDLNSPLWSDGAIKRRFVMPPDGRDLGYTAEGAWDVPPGTIFMKEFLFEREPGNRASVFPMETRLLIKRCEEGECLSPWQGYSFEWNADGTDAALLENAVDEEYHDWPFANGAHRHTYPGRAQCTHCHLLAAGGTLGVHTAQLNRNFNYGGVVDNQLRALQHAGVLGAVEPRAFADAPRLPTPADTSFSLEARARAYLHGNCAGCHRPGGSWPVVDYRYQVSLADSQICQLLTPGNAETSKLYLKDRARSSNDLPDWVTGEPMPPFATLIPDQRQLSITKSWIDGMKSCP